MLEIDTGARHRRTEQPSPGVVPVLPDMGIFAGPGEVEQRNLENTCEQRLRGRESLSRTIVDILEVAQAGLLAIGAT